MIASMRCPLPVCSSSPSANSFKSTPCIFAFAGRNRKKSSRLKVKATASQQEEDFQVLTAIQTRYNNVVIVDTSESRLLLLNSTRTPLDSRAFHS
ncbi:hypothetical protein SASPL_145196 [Salvia splendens]|uniref:Uncharacterized protein n=1 Tax=Salvia splendens TaxID=180675 RepID=A0A8X8Z7X6_SALSN|nr:hypothetical protein SASPL_145196 [Salvia splendens]